jgi:hypothetical protein
LKGTTYKPGRCICRRRNCHAASGRCGVALPVPRGARQKLCAECLANHTRTSNTASVRKWRRKPESRAKVHATERRFYQAHKDAILKKKRDDRTANPEETRAAEKARYHKKPRKYRAKGRKNYQNHKTARLTNVRDYRVRVRTELADLRKRKRPDDWLKKPITWRIIGDVLLSRDSYMSNPEVGKQLDEDGCTPDAAVLRDYKNWGNGPQLSGITRDQAPVQSSKMGQRAISGQNLAGPVDPKIGREEDPRESSQSVQILWNESRIVRNPRPARVLFSPREQICHLFFPRESASQECNSQVPKKNPTAGGNLRWATSRNAGPESPQVDPKCHPCCASRAFPIPKDQCLFLPSDRAVASRHCVKPEINGPLLGVDLDQVRGREGKAGENRAPRWYLIHPCRLRPGG